MKLLNVVTLFLVVLGAYNWGLIGLFDYSLAGALLGDSSGYSRVFYVLVGFSGLWQSAALLKHLSQS